MTRALIPHEETWPILGDCLRGRDTRTFWVMWDKAWRNSGPRDVVSASHLPVHLLAYCFAAKLQMFSEEVNVFAEYGVLNY